MIKKEDVINAMKNCKDPELGLDIITLGLVYNIEINNNNIKIDMTLTSPMCPFGSQIIDDVKFNINEIEGVENVEVNLVFDPPWEPSDDLKIMMGVE